MHEVKVEDSQAFVMPRRKFSYRFIYNQLLIVVGSLIAAFGYALFQVPFQIAAGGIGGLALIVTKYAGLNVGTLYFLLSMPLVVWGFFQLGRMKFLLSTINSVIVFSIASNLFVTHLPNFLTVYPVSQNILLNSVYAGITSGLGVGLVFRAGGTMGGTGIPARIIQRRTGFPLSQSYLFSDLFIIIIAGFVFSWEQAMLATLTMFLAGMTSDFVLEGSSQIRMAMIITANPEKMSKALMQELHRGVSMWDITGAYSNEPKKMLYCTLNRSQVAELKYLVAIVDPKAFLVIGNGQQAWGGVGFTLLKSQGEK